MSALRDVLTSLGHADVRTLLQSGNVVLRAAGNDGATLEASLESSLLVERLGLRADVIVRSATEWATVVATNPFPGEAERDPSHLVLFAKRPVTQAAFNIPGIAIAKAGGRETIGGPDPYLYVTHPDGIGRSKITTPLIERALGTPVTGRNWNAVMKLLALADGLDARPSEQGRPSFPTAGPAPASHR